MDDFDSVSNTILHMRWLFIYVGCVGGDYLEITTKQLVSNVICDRLFCAGAVRHDCVEKSLEEFCRDFKGIGCVVEVLLDEVEMGCVSEMDGLLDEMFGQRRHP